MQPLPETPGVRLAPGVTVPDAALSFTFASSSGPGGQNVNKRATKAVLRVRLADLPIPFDALDRLRSLGSLYLTTHDELVIPADENRSQERNKSEAIDRLSDLVKRALVRPKKRRATRPSRGSKERRLAEKKHRGEIKRRRGGED
ncbi:Peptidyl-tRNA hydrolase ArfB [Phycisphaerales bacterium]|nr:Peptidyl-tRNA hydrolase ArfB [Phycisphaerales bacterium]